MRIEYDQGSDLLYVVGIEIMNASRKVDLAQIQPVNFEIVGVGEALIPRGRHVPSMEKHFPRRRCRLSWSWSRRFLKYMCCTAY